MIGLLLVAASAATAKPREVSSREIDDELFQWCLGQFPDDFGELASVQRPAQKLAPLVMHDLPTPRDLTSETVTVGKLPAEIERYRGVWIWPSAGEQAPGAIFVERLTPDEMTVVFAHKPDKHQTVEDAQASRMQLKWSGSAFSRKTTFDGGSDETILKVSRSGETLLMASIHRQLRTLEYENGVKGEPFWWGEAWPACFISAKHL